jgi:N-formylglutamate amidohydrolase
MDDCESTAFEILAPPQWTAPMLFNSPHSGHILPPSLLAHTRLSESALHSSEDSHVDKLFMGCIAAGAPMLHSLVSRSFIDLNREPFEFDARMFRETLPGYMNPSSPRVASGLGTIPRTVGDGMCIYAGPISLQEALHRVEAYYRPYHRALAGLLEEAHAATGRVLLVDCHSMPSSAVMHQRGFGSALLDVVVGDRFGRACDASLVALIEDHLASAGLKVARNKPYAGGFITEGHGRPHEGRHAVQIELNRSLYMDEHTRQPHQGFAPLRQVLDDLAHKLAMAMGGERPARLAFAAE